jgi:hypothetical protein
MREQLFEFCDLFKHARTRVLIGSLLIFSPLMKTIEIFRKDATGQVDLASLMREIKDEEVINNPNNVKVVTDQNDFALYFHVR